MFRYYLKFFIFAFFFTGCGGNAPMVPQAKIEELSHLLGSLDKGISQKEATQLSKDILYKTRQLTEEFEMISPPQFHNFLVTVGLRDKGLCYHWSDALYLYLLEKNYESFEFHLMGSNIGEYLFEHNALIVVAKGGKIQEGIIIDPWRNSGELYFSKVGDDPKYIWQHRPIRGCR